METRAPADVAASEPIYKDEEFRNYENRGTYNDNVVWAHEKTGVLMRPDEATNFRLRNDPVWYAKTMQGVDLSKHGAESALASVDPDLFSDEPDARGKIEEYARMGARNKKYEDDAHAFRLAYAQSHGMAPSARVSGRSNMTDAERAALSADLDREAARTEIDHGAYAVHAVPQGGMPHLAPISPEELEWRKVQETTLANESKRAIADATRHMGPAPARPAIGEVTAYNRAMFDETLPPRDARGIVSQPTTSEFESDRKGQGAGDYGGSALRATLAEQVAAKSRRNAR